MPQQTEPSTNNALGELLAKMLPGSVVRSEHTQVIVDHPGLQPDILVTAPGRSPVVLEAEYMPATNAESEAKARLGLEVVATTGRLIESAIALRYPEDLRSAGNLGEALSAATISYCVVGEDEDRFPNSGWIEGGVGDLAELVRLVSVPQRAVDEAADALEKGIERAASIMNQLHESRPDVMPAIAGLLGMADVIQTRRMAGAIIANAMVFHERLGGMHGVKPLSQLCANSVGSPKREILSAWTADTQDQLLADLRDSQGHRRPGPGRRGRPASDQPAFHRRGRCRHRREPGPRPHRAHLPASDCRPQVPRHLLHAALIRRAAGTPGRRQALS